MDYEKRKNTLLFKTLQDMEGLNKIQNYIPIFNRFFTLNETNYNSINMNNKWYIYNVLNKDKESDNVFNCSLKNIKNEDTKERSVFFKYAPLIDPFKFLIGKYNIRDPILFNMPDLKNIAEVHPKILDENNSAYIDGLFSFLSSQLISKNGFLHGVDFYGSFIAIKNNFKINVADDIDYLCKSDFFNKNKNIAFQIEDYSSFMELELEEEDPIPSLKPITIDHTKTSKSLISLCSFDDTFYDEVFEKIEKNGDKEEEGEKEGEKEEEEEEKGCVIEGLEDLSKANLLLTDNCVTTLKSNSTCSSRTSHTSSNNDLDEEDMEDIEEKKNGEDVKQDKKYKKYKDKEDKEDKEQEEEEEEEEKSCSDYSDEEEPRIDLTIPQFPVNVICMEKCDNTFDDLMSQNDLSDAEMFSALMQVVMILLTYQKVFSFTHNDLHTNNVMYNETEKKFLYYCYNKKYYKVPTFGRIFKIIDFGRAIYKYNGLTFCSDAFQVGADAATQYNTEPYFNNKKPRLEPNFSFDLCRLGCSIFDYLIDELEEIDDLKKCSPVIQVVVDWCKDDNGLNVLYKNNGSERYPDFKLYKMIARCAHNHTPQAQLERPEFANFLIARKEISKNATIMNIDNMPVLTAATILYTENDFK